MKLTAPLINKIVVPLVVFVLFLVGIFVAVAGFYWATGPMDTSTTETSRFVITRGESTTRIGQELTDAGYIRHPLVFRLAVRQLGLGDKIQAGSFLLSPSQDIWSIAKTLTEGTEDVWVTIPEGYRVEEVAQAFANVDLSEFDSDEFIALAQDKEGYLFPDTYLVPKLITAPDVFDLLTRTFDQKVTKGLADEIAASKYPFDQAMVMASLIQRESGKDPEEMRHVAGVLWNRVAAGQGLGVDATLQYIAGYDQNTERWWAAPDISIKNSNSPYNTYKFAGLPPAPIANPGIDAIKAALNPLATSDYFYLHAGGMIYYARDLAGHTRNIEQYLR